MYGNPRGLGAAAVLLPATGAGFSGPMLAGALLLIVTGALLVRHSRLRRTDGSV